MLSELEWLIPTQLLIEKRGLCDGLFAGVILANVCRRLSIDHRSILQQCNVSAAGGNHRSWKIQFLQAGNEGSGIPGDRDFLRRSNVKIGAKKHPSESR